MKTQVITTDLATIKTAMSNPFGMDILNTPDVRTAVADYVKLLVAKLHAEKK